MLAAAVSKGRDASAAAGKFNFDLYLILADETAAG